MSRICLAALVLCAHGAPTSPHIVMMVLDDVGWADVSYHGGNFPTPNLDKLATEQGVRFEKYYVQPVCSPTRSSFISGRYPFHTGMQHHDTIAPGATVAIPNDVPTIAEVLKKAGYSTHAIGKWHLGSARWQDTPTGRGFDSHMGYLQGAESYYNHTMGANVANATGKIADLTVGYDFWCNKTAAWEYAGQYSMDPYMAEARRILETRDPATPMFLYFAHQLIHQPLEKPPLPSSTCDHITSDLPFGADRNTLCTMMVELDNQIGVFVEWMRQYGLWENTLMWVTTDNGGMTAGMKETKGGGVYSVSSNYPLRGGKTTLFEGGVRGVSFLTGGALPQKNFGAVRNGLMQHVDVPATLATVAGAQLSGTDGYDMWQYITSGGESPRREVPVNIDTCVGFLVCQHNKAFNALISENWKLISNNGSITYDGWWANDPYVKREPNSTQGPVNMNGNQVWLFDLAKDEDENDNVASAHPKIVASMLDRMSKLADPQNGYLKEQYNGPHLRAFPLFHNGTWAPWKRDAFEALVV